MKKGIFLRISAKILCCMCLLGSAVAFEATAAPAAEQQQGQRVQGTVRDSNGEPLIGASVLVKGSTIGVSTNADGQFTIDAKANSTLVVSYVGFKTTEVRAKGDLNITLQDDAANLDDIVVLGYGASQKKQDLSASVGVVTNPASSPCAAVQAASAEPCRARFLVLPFPTRAVILQAAPASLSVAKAHLTARACSG